MLWWFHDLAQLNGPRRTAVVHDALLLDVLGSQRRLGFADQSRSTVSNAVALIGASSEPLQGADLSGLYVTDCNLEGARLDGCDLRKSSLAQCVLRNASLLQCNVDDLHVTNNVYDGPLPALRGHTNLVAAVSITSDDRAGR